MAEEIDLNFLGEQIRRLQVDMRDLKSRAARTDADVVALNEQMATLNDRLEALQRHLDAGFLSVDQRFDQVGREFAVVHSELVEIRSEMTRNLEIVLTAIREQRE